MSITKQTYRNVDQAINRAQAAYDNRHDAASEAVVNAEDWLNGAHASADEIMDALNNGRLNRSASTGRIYVQLKRRT